MKFFFDRCVPVRIAMIVSAYEVAHEIRHLDNDSRFNPRTPDEVWMDVLAKDIPSWIVISADYQILKSKIQRAQLAKSGLTFFCLRRGWFDLNIHDQAWKFLKAWPKIVDNALHTKHKVFEIAAGSSLKIDPIQ